MKQVLKRLKEGIYEYAEGTVEFSVPKISITGKKNEKLTGQITIWGNTKEEFCAYLYSSHYRMELEQEKITGQENVLSYVCDTYGMEEGDLIKGEITLISNAGQFLLPFEVVVAEELFQSSLGAVKNLFHFANLAKTNWNEAVSFFYSKDFIQILKGNDKQYRMAYEGLAKYKMNQQNVEEFLLMIHKKQPVTYSLSQTEGEFEASEGRCQEKLVIERNGWGYSRLFLTTDVPFLRLEKEEICETDFLGNRCELPFYIDGTKLHEGYNTGTIRLFHSMVSLEYKVTIKNQKSFGREISYKWEMKRSITRILREYIAFRLKKTTKENWLKNTKEIIDAMLGLNSKNIKARLLQAQLLIVEEKFNEAKWVLGHVKNMMEEDRMEDEEYGYFLYVTALYEKTDEVIDQAALKVEELLRKNPNSTMLLWMLFYLKEEYENDYGKRYQLLEEAYDRGVNSPILYTEAYLALCKDPAFLARLGEYELQVLAFIVKNHLLSKEIINQIVYLAGKEKEYRAKLFYILRACYEKNKDKEILGIICNLLIKGNCTGTEWFFWYEQAVREELRITRLYEYYMLSLDKRKEELLPKTLLLYFSYECTMDYENAAYIYANVVRHKEEIPELYESYEKQIEAFLAKQIMANHINGHLAYLYKKMLGEQMITEELSEHLAGLLFCYEIVVESEDMKQVIVLCGQLEGERSYPLLDKTARISLYTEDYTILLEDKWGNRHGTKGLYQLKRFLQPELFLSFLEEKVKNHVGFFLYMSHEQRAQCNIQESHMYGYKLLLKEEQIHKEYKKDLLMKIIPFLYERDSIEELDVYLKVMDFTHFKQKERAEMITYLVIRDMYEKAYETICSMGFEGVRIKTLLQICSYMLERMTEEDKKLLELCGYVFKNRKYNTAILSYLERYAKGNPRYLRDIWQTAIGAGMEAYHLSERILLICLFSGCFLSGKSEIFHYYFSGKPQEQIVEGYLSESAYEYFVKEQVVEEGIFGDMITFYGQSGNISHICMLAFLKYFSLGDGSLSIQEKQMARKFLMELMKQDIYFPFFLCYKDIFPALALYSGYTYIEYKGEIGSRTVIHYVIEKEGEECENYKNEEMKEVYAGIFQKKFVLFFGERLQYYITEEVHGKETLTESGTIERNDMVGEESESRFRLLNHMAMSQSLKEYESMEEIADEYTKKVWQCEQLFIMK